MAISNIYDTDTYLLTALLRQALHIFLALSGPYSGLNIWILKKQIFGREEDNRACRVQYSKAKVNF